MTDGVVQLEVSDCGPGIPEGQLERVFEPFVTSRDQGLGLGLAISRSIMTAHNGLIRADHNVAGGATFRCVLPAADTSQRYCAPLKFFRFPSPPVFVAARVSRIT